MFFLSIADGSSLGNALRKSDTRVDFA